MKTIPNLQSNQKDPQETQLEQRLQPHEFYNKFIRKEGEKVLDKGEFEEMMKGKIIAADINDIEGTAQIIDIG